jgi:hypothetical protein
MYDGQANAEKIELLVETIRNLFGLYQIKVTQHISFGC